jgi:hypothetical protein
MFKTLLEGDSFITVLSIVTFIIVFVVWSVIGFCFVSNKQKPKTNNEHKVKVFTNKPVRWLDTCSCNATPQPHTAVMGKITDHYYLERKGNRFEGRASYTRELFAKPWELKEFCTIELDNGKVLHKPVESLYLAEDGILEYHN